MYTHIYTYIDGLFLDTTQRNAAVPEAVEIHLADAVLVADAGSKAWRYGQRAMENPHGLNGF